MHRHGPDRLEGPVTRKCWRWLAMLAEDSTGKPEVDSATSQEGPPIRRDLVERVRREIAAGVYETPEKWEKALDRLFEELQRE